MVKCARTVTVDKESFHSVLGSAEVLIAFHNEMISLVQKGRAVYIAY